MRTVSLPPNSLILACALAWAGCDKTTDADKSGGDAAEKSDEGAKGQDAETADAKSGEDTPAGDAKADEAKPSDAKAGETNAVDELVEGAMAEAEDRVGGAAKFFDPSDKAFRKRACEFLTADMVSEQFEVPAADLKQMQIAGCIYTWDDDDEMVDAKVMMPRVHKSEDRAKLWFTNATKSLTKEELDAQLEMVKGKLDDEKMLKRDIEKKTAKSITDIAKMSNPEEGVTYEDVPGIGDEARISSSDGTLWVRLGNFTMQVSAYKGGKQPKPELDPRNTKAFVKATLEAQKKWLADTYEQRKAAVTVLAPKVVAAVEKLQEQ